MPKYFMGDTRLGGLERMMMDPSRSASSATEPRQNSHRKKTLPRQPDKPRIPEQSPKEDRA